jgi:hypothetical protein
MDWPAPLSRGTVRKQHYPLQARPGEQNGMARLTEEDVLANRL